MYKERVVQFRSLTSDRFLMTDILSKDLWTLGTLVFGWLKPKRDSTKWITQKTVTVYCDGHANCLIVSYNFRFETIKGLDYFQELDTYILSVYDAFPYHAVIQQNGAPHIIARSTLIWMRSSWIEGLYDIVQHVQQKNVWQCLAPLDFFVREFVTDEEYLTSVLKICASWSKNEYNNHSCQSGVS